MPAKSLKLSKIKIKTTQKEILEQLSNQKILLKNVFKKNHQKISELQELGKQNAFIYLQRQKLGQSLSLFEENNLYKAVLKLQEKLKLKNVPRRIECYDISHLSGKYVYGSMVTFIDGNAVKKLYKLFRCPDKNNDFENHKEVLSRRLKRALNETKKDSTKQNKPNAQNNPWSLPDLIIVDGGKGQLSSDSFIINQYRQEFEGINKPFDIELVGLAKREEEIFLEGQKEPVILEGEPKFLVQRIRDEAHRFAISNNKKLRLKQAKKSRLDEIDGLGVKTKEKLLTAFGSVDQVAKNAIENSELLVELVGQKMTSKIQKHFGGYTRPT